MLKLILVIFALVQLNNAGLLDLAKSPDCLNIAVVRNFDINKVPLISFNLKIKLELNINFKVCWNMVWSL